MIVKRMLCLILAAFMVAALAACDDGGATEATGTAVADTEATAATIATGDPTVASEPTLPATIDEVQPTEPPEQEGLDMKAFLRTFDRTAQIEEAVVHDADNVKITALKLRYDPILGAAVQLRVENSSERDLLIQADTCAVNGFMMHAEINLVAAAGTRTDGELTASYPLLALANVQRIATLEFSLLLMDRSSFEVLAVSEPVEIQTTAYEDYEQTYDEEGQTAYDDRGIRIVLKSVDRSRQVSENPVLPVLMENNSDRPVTILSKSVLVNGYDLTTAMATTILPGKRAVDFVTFFEKDLSEYDIDEFESVEVGFRIVDEETWETIVETETVMLEEE